MLRNNIFMGVYNTDKNIRHMKLVMNFDFITNILLREVNRLSFHNIPFLSKLHVNK
jgi:hypothetical protein